MFAYSSQESGIWPIIMISACVMNSDHAPWDDAKWYSAGRVAVESYLSISNPSSCPVFAELAPESLPIWARAGLLQRRLCSELGKASAKLGNIRLRRWVCVCGFTS